MQTKAMMLGAVLLAASAGPGLAQVVDGANVDAIVTAARNIGSATLGSHTDGLPKITGQIGEVTYVVYFKNCVGGQNCEDLNFYAGFAGTKPALETINAWNRDNRFGKAYLDSDLDAIIEFDFNLQYGVSQQNLNAAFLIWSLVLDHYTNYIGFR